MSADVAAPVGGAPELDIDLRLTPSTQKASRRPVDWTGSDQLLPDRGAHPAGQDRALRRSRFDHWSRSYTRIMALTDGVVAALAVFLTLHSYRPATGFSNDKSAFLVLGAALAWPLAVLVCHGYRRSDVGVGDAEHRAVFHATVLAIAASAVPSAALDKYGLVSLAVAAIPATAAVSVVTRFVARRVLHQRQRAGHNLRRVVLVGHSSNASELHQVITREQQHGLDVAGVCVPREETDVAERLGLTVLGNLEEVADVVRHGDVDAVAVAGGDAAGSQFLRSLSWSLEGLDVDLLVHPGLVEVAGPRMHIRPHVGLPLLQVEQPNFDGWRRIVKRGADLLLGAVGLVAALPLFLLVAVAIKLEDRGPVFFKQVRVGVQGTTFTMWKFRSMHLDAESRLEELRRDNPGTGFMFKLPEDPRITRAGRLLRRFSLDELPQLVNVLLGSMSLVGPRPPLQSEVDAYENHARRRLLVTPGLTGLWQVSGRSLLTWEETVRLDLRYVENWSLTLDLLIVWRTLFAVVGRRGAF